MARRPYESETRAVNAVAEDTQRHRMQAELSRSPVQGELTEILDSEKESERGDSRNWILSNDM